MLHNSCHISHESLEGWKKVQNPYHLFVTKIIESFNRIWIGWVEPSQVDCVIHPSPFTSSNLEYRYKAPLDIPNLHVEYLSSTHCQIRFNENTYLSNLSWWFYEFSDPTYLYLFVKKSIGSFDKIQIMKKSRSLILSNRPTYGYIHLKFWISIVRAIFVVFDKFHD